MVVNLRPMYTWVDKTLAWIWPKRPIFQPIAMFSDETHRRNWLKSEATLQRGKAYQRISPTSSFRVLSYTKCVFVKNWNFEFRDLWMTNWSKNCSTNSDKKHDNQVYKYGRNLYELREEKKGGLGVCEENGGCSGNAGGAQIKLKHQITLVISS